MDAPKLWRPLFPSWSVSSPDSPHVRASLMSLFPLNGRKILSRELEFLVSSDTIIRCDEPR